MSFVDRNMSNTLKPHFIEVSVLHKEYLVLNSCFLFTKPYMMTLQLVEDKFLLLESSKGKLDSSMSFSSLVSICWKVEISINIKVSLLVKLFCLDFYADTDGCFMVFTDRC
jgi:hypothetical protein